MSETKTPFLITDFRPSWWFWWKAGFCFSLGVMGALEFHELVSGFIKGLFE